MNDNALGASCAREKNISPRKLVERYSAIGLLLLVAPVLFFIAATIALTDGSPVLFRHRRIGLGGKQFYCFKFRTMALNGDAILEKHLQENPSAAEEWRATRKLSKDPRVTWIGSLLRQLSLDEIPQLINIARGEMSFVGPRPIVSAEISKYGDHFLAYCSVKPGLTGLWQVSGRSNTSYEQRVALDMEYIRSHSLLLDWKILLQTLPVVLSRKGSV